MVNDPFAVFDGMLNGLVFMYRTFYWENSAGQKQQLVYQRSDCLVAIFQLFRRFPYVRCRTLSGLYMLFCRGSPRRTPVLTNLILAIQNYIRIRLLAIVLRFKGKLFGFRFIDESRHRPLPVLQCGSDRSRFKTEQLDRRNQVGKKPCFVYQSFSTELFR